MPLTLKGKSKSKYHLKHKILALEQVKVERIGLTGAPV